MAITAADVKKLRDATGAGMMDAKKALTEAEGDHEKAIELLRISGLAKAAKRTDREATNGIVAGRDGILIQFAAETDFVAKNAEFVGLADQIVEAVASSGAKDLETTKAAPLGSATVQEAVQSIWLVHMWRPSVDSSRGRPQSRSRSSISAQAAACPSWS